MQLADVLLHPARQEPLGRVLLEASASALPIVTTQVGGSPEILVGPLAAANLFPVAIVIYVTRLAMNCEKPLSIGFRLSIVRILWSKPTFTYLIRPIEQLIRLKNSVGQTIMAGNTPLGKVIEQPKLRVVVSSPSRWFKKGC